MTDYIKQIQTKVNREIRKLNKELGVSKSQVREVFDALGLDTESPGQDELEIVFSEMVNQFSSQQTNTLSTDKPAEDGLVVASQAIESVEIPAPEIIEITSESHPDLWETLQPPAEESQSVEEASAIAPIPQDESTSESALAKSESSLPAQPSASGLIPQSQVAGMVNQAFSDQPPQLQQQITEYAMERTFTNVREVQSFLEQMRSMEFDLMVKTLQDHFQRRGSMLTVLNEVLAGQKQKDDEASQAFFGNFNSRLVAFQQEMEARLSKQGL